MAEKHNDAKETEPRCTVAVCNVHHDYIDLLNLNHIVNTFANCNERLLSPMDITVHTQLGLGTLIGPWSKVDFLFGVLL